MNNIIDELDKELEEDTRKVKISVQKRNNKKYWTIIEELDTDNPKKFLKFVKKNLHCNVKYDKDLNIYQFQGNHRDDIKNIISTNFGINNFY